MLQFRTASRSADELKTAKQELDEMFSVVIGTQGRMNAKGVREIEENRFELAELIVQLISDEVAVTDPLPFLVESVSGDIRDQYIWQEMNSTLRVVNRSYGTKPHSQRLTFEEYGISTSHKELAVEIALEEVASGRITASQVAEEMAQTILRNRIKTVLDALDAAVPSQDDQTGLSGYTLRYTGLTQANFDKAIDGLQDEAEGVTMFGRHIALAPAIRAFTGFADGTLMSDATKDALNVRGVIGTYHGAPIVTLRDQFHKRDPNTHLIGNDKVYLASGTKGAIWMEKDVSFLNWSVVDPRTSTFGTGIRLEDGLLVHDANQYRVMTAT
jgi:hypothetical protein